jgi:hypothetical protein
VRWDAAVIEVTPCAPTWEVQHAGVGGGTYRTGDCLDHPTRPVCFAHCVNDVSKWGAGFLAGVRLHVERRGIMIVHLAHMPETSWRHRDGWMQARGLLQVTRCGSVASRLLGGVTADVPEDDLVRAFAYALDHTHAKLTRETG